jgi:1,4-dihydroxy-2-naphthoate octaprenyltransferase
MATSRTAVWLQAFRLHTLPLAVAAIAMGNFVAYDDNMFSPLISGLTFVTAICLQILSNLANDYGDAKHGADNPERLGPKRMVQSGMISGEQIKAGIVIFMLLSLLSGCILLILSVKNIGYTGAMGLFLLGILAIAAAIAYTATKKPYGYRALGDFSVFIFFGLLAVAGSYYLQTGNFKPSLLLPAAGMGLLSTGVLNINNIRDLEADERANKRTIALHLGLGGAKFYHWILLLSGFICFAVYVYLHLTSPYQYLFLIPGILLIVNALGVQKSHQPHEINPYLKQLVISTLIFTISFGLGLILF